MASTEDIEAKLCAYIEGQLDPADRAEIESHLQANPQHRALIEELARTRVLMQNLPRESAPEEILENIQGQLERSALLQDIDERQTTATLRINRWPHYAAVAAVLLLTAGLGIVIFLVLPRAQHAPDDYAIAPPATLPLSEARIDTHYEREHSTGNRSEIDAAAPDAALRADRTPAPPVAAGQPGDHPVDAAIAPSAGDAMAMKTAPVEAKGGPDEPPDAFGELKDAPDQAKGAPAGGGWDRDRVAAAPAPPAKVEENFTAPPGTPGTAGAGVDLEAARERLSNADVARQLQEASQLGENALFVVVRTDDTAATRQQVAQYFTSNQIPWEELPQQTPTPLAPSQRVMMSRQNREPQVRLKGGVPAATSDTSSNEWSQQQAATAPAAGSVASSQQQFKQEPGPARQRAPLQQAEVQSPQQIASEQAEMPGAQAQALAPTEPGSQSVDEGQSISMDSDAAARQQSQAPSEEMIIARGLTRRQAVDLSQSLAKQNVALYEQPILNRGRAVSALEDSHPPQALLYSRMLNRLGQSPAPVVRLDDAAAVPEVRQFGVLETLPPATAPAQEPMAKAALVGQQAATTAPSAGLPAESMTRSSGSDVVDVVIVMKNAPANAATSAPAAARSEPSP